MANLTKREIVLQIYQKAGFHHHAEEDIDIGGGYFMNDHVLDLPL